MLCSAIDCALNINVVQYTVPMKKLCGTARLVCISDLHCWSYGRDNCKLYKLVSEQKPDAIVIAGDMITRRASNKQVQKSTELIKKLTELAPVYYATGNHEADFLAVNGMSLLDSVEKTGAEVLYDSYAEASINGNTLRIGAASGRYFDGSERDKITFSMLEEIGKSEAPSIAVVHQPENVLFEKEHISWTADLYLSGHTHGGIWRLPIIGGVMTPAEGLFPKYDRGLFSVDDKTPIIINGGLAGYYFIPRVFNRPEICVINIKQ